MPPFVRELTQPAWSQPTTATILSRIFIVYTAQISQTFLNLPSPRHSYLLPLFQCILFCQTLHSHTCLTYHDVSNWYTKAPARNPLLCDINLTGSHWKGIIVDTNKHHLTYYDSLGDYRGENKQALYYNCEWLLAELQHQSRIGIFSSDR